MPLLCLVCLLTAYANKQDQVGYKPMGFNPATPHHSDGFLGKPNPELDRNWRKLLLSRCFALYRVFVCLLQC